MKKRQPVTTVESRPLDSVRFDSEENSFTGRPSFVCPRAPQDAHKKIKRKPEPRKLQPHHPGGNTAPSREHVCERIQGRTGHGMPNVFFSANGGTGNERLSDRLSSQSFTKTVSTAPEIASRLGAWFFVYIPTLRTTKAISVVQEARLSVSLFIEL